MLYRVEPILRPMVWGSELWVLSGYKDRLSVIAEGPCKGMNINELVAREKERLLGRKVYERTGDEFPLLVKFLDVHAPLSIQVHPSEEFAQTRQGLHGKTEMWYVIRAEKDAQLYAGMSSEITPDEFVRRSLDGTVTDVLARHDIKAGDVFFIPTGRVHALLEGSYIAEIQQTSDSTYRIWDYNRPGLDGKPRELHTELAKDAIDYKVYPDYRTHYEPRPDAEVPLVSCEYFSTSLLDLHGRFDMDLSSIDSFVILMGLEGSGEVECGGVAMNLAADGCLLVPACADGVSITPGPDGLKLLSCCVL